MVSEITPLILTYNEAPNIERTLSRLKWAKEILVVDSFSTDETLDLVRKLPQARIVQREFDSFARQCNFGLQQIRTEWVLSLDADYLLPEPFVSEVTKLQSSEQVAGYRAAFKYCICGRPLRASLYPPRVVLYRRDRASYRDEGHGHRVQIEGNIFPLRSVIYHDDRKPLDRWLHEQERYARIEAEHLLGAKSQEPRAETVEFSLADRVRQMIVFAPFVVFFYTLLGKGLILDGWPGWFYVFQRTYAEVVLSLRLLEARLSRGPRDHRTTGQRDQGTTGPIC
jgi:glycosyltransferase involved in cell wall biosynthesis